MAGAAAAATSSSSPWPEMLSGVVLESRRVVAAHSRHFLSLSVLFLLPLSSLLVAAPPLLLPFLSSASGHRPSTNSFLLLRRGPSAAASAVLAVLYAAAVIVLLLAAFAAVSNSVLRGFYGRPVKILHALRSLFPPLGRLLLTLSLALLLPSLLLASLFKVLSFLHLPISVIVALVAAAVAVGLLLFQLNWTLAGVISVLEPSWGFATLWRSADLMKGMRWASLILSLFFGAGIGLTLWGLSLGGEEVHAAGRDWTGALPVVTKTVVGSAITAVLLLYWMVTTVVLYLYCKALHGELASEIAEEFAWEYVCLPFDESRAPHVVSVIRQ